jgi:hypothetical protein
MKSDTFPPLTVQAGKVGTGAGAAATPTHSTNGATPEKSALQN